MRSEDTKCISMNTYKMIHMIKLTKQNLLISLDDAFDPEEKIDFLIMSVYELITEGKQKKTVSLMLNFKKWPLFRVLIYQTWLLF